MLQTAAASVSVRRLQQLAALGQTAPNPPGEQLKTAFFSGSLPRSCGSRNRSMGNMQACNGKGSQPLT